jgi:hypothetical protein
MESTKPDFGIYAVAFENGDHCHVESFESGHAEALACELAGQRAAAHCQFMRRPAQEEMQSERPYSRYMPHAVTQ